MLFVAMALFEYAWLLSIRFRAQNDSPAKTGTSVSAGARRSAKDITPMYPTAAEAASARCKRIDRLALRGFSLAFFSFVVVYWITFTTKSRA